MSGVSICLQSAVRKFCRVWRRRWLLTRGGRSDCGPACTAGECGRGRPHGVASSLRATSCEVSWGLTLVRLFTVAVGSEGFGGLSGG